MRIHLIAIGGAVMHNLAIALLKKGHVISGSDDEIFEPSRSMLEMHGLLPDRIGWDPTRIDANIDTVILGMHAREDNPELHKARELEIDIKSFPEFLYEQSINKKRIVIGGSHGKTTITSMIMHVLKTLGMKFDYMVGSRVEGFDTMVGMEEGSEVAIFEGDEYLASALDRRPKFHLYNPDIAVISGIAWDHINVFPSFDQYVDQFRIFINKITPGGTLIYCENDSRVKQLAETTRNDIKLIPYTIHEYINRPEGYIVRYDNSDYRLSIFGSHNMENLSAAREVCAELGISHGDFLNAITGFSGSARRLQLLGKSSNKALYIDFAHAPSKVKATVSAIAEAYPDHTKVCCFELHTFSSLNPDYIDEYKNCMVNSDVGFIYYNPHVIQLKRLKALSKDSVAKKFGKGVTKVFDDSKELILSLKEIKSDRIVYLLMSSGDFNGTNFKILTEELITGLK